MKRIKSECLEIEISESGAELRSIRKDGAEYLWQGDEAHWQRHAPLLFPFVGRMNEQRYIYKGRSYEMTKHGFALSSHFSVVSNTGNSVTFFLSSNGETKSIYPFDFTLLVTYSADGNVLKETVEVLNTGNDAMLYGLGFHPGFAIPLDKGLSLDDYSVTFPYIAKAEKRAFAEDRLEAGYDESADEVDGKTIHLSAEIFKDDAIVLTETGGEAVLSSLKGSRNVRVLYDTPYLGLWQTYAPDTPFLCIEPWYTLPGRTGTIVDIEKRNDFLTLSPGGKRSHSISIIIE